MIKASQQRPTITAGAYASGDAIGGLLTFNLSLNQKNDGIVVSATLVDLNKQSVSIDLILFSQSFAVTADNAAFAPVDADMKNFIGAIQFLSTDYMAFSASSAVSAKGIVSAYYSTDSLGKVYGQLVARGAPTYASTQDLIVTLWSLQE